jgi:hypothetical protein
LEHPFSQQLLLLFSLPTLQDPGIGINKEQQTNERKALHDESIGTSITAATGIARP